MEVVEGEVLGNNRVDVSNDAIDSEWSRIVSEHEAGEIPKVNVSGDGSINFEKKPEVDPGIAAALDQIASAEMIIKGALKLAFDTFGGLDLPAEKYDAVARPWAVVIVKHFDGGIFEFMSKYKDEIAAAWATIVFASAVKAGMVVKAKKFEKSEKPEKEEVKAGE